MSEPTNAQMAHECMRTAETAASSYKANVESMAAQTYATLALVDEIREMRSFVAEYLAAVEDMLAVVKEGAK